MQMRGENILVTVTDKAKSEINSLLKDKESQEAIRVYIAGIGCGGPTLGLKLDVANDDDNIFDVENFQVIVNKEELPNIGDDIKIELKESRWGAGLSVTSSLSSKG